MSDKETNILSYFSDMKDPRIERNKDHLLEDIVFISLAAVISGAETWNEIELYGKQKIDWLSSFLELPNGIPSHDTFNRFFSFLDPNEFESCFLNWVNSINKITDGEVVAIDGKTMRGSKLKGCKSATHIVSAWASENELILGQIKVDNKSNEITAIPQLLEVLLLKGNIVTIDAMGCQKSIAEKIISNEADYVLSVKDNHKELRRDIEESFQYLKATQTYSDTECDHGRIETRKCTVISDLSMLMDLDKWCGIKSIVRLESERIFKSSGKTETETRYYISSLPANAKQIEKVVRKHWGIENKVHWCLDVAFNEDNSRKRNKYSAQNYSVINRIALNLLRKDNTKIGIKGKRFKAAMNNEFLLKILTI